MVSAAAVACALLGAAALTASSAASAASIPQPGHGAALVSSLRDDIKQYLATRGKAEHISAVSLRVTFPGRAPGIGLAVGTNRYDGGSPVSASELWPIGSNTKAFTTVILLQLEAEGKLSINDRLGKWLPQYPAWRGITIKRLLNMTSGIASYATQPAFVTTLAARLRTDFTAARLVSYAVGVPLGPAGFSYSDTNYILAQMIIERVTHDSYADQLAKRIITPLRLHGLCYAPYTCPAADAARMPTGYFFMSGVPSLLGQPVPPLALTWAQGAGGIVSSLANLTTWARALYQGRELPPGQQRQLESLVSEATGRPIPTTTLADPAGYGLGLQQVTTRQRGTEWQYIGGTLGYRVELVYFPRSRISIAFALNSATDQDKEALAGLEASVYQSLQKAAAAQAG